MKKLICLLSLALSLFIFAAPAFACGGDHSGEEAQTQTKSDTETAQADEAKSCTSCGTDACTCKSCDKCGTDECACSKDKKKKKETKKPSA